jgi:hypothetical protein
MDRWLDAPRRGSLATFASRRHHAVGVALEERLTDTFGDVPR